jgi:SAM-dependent methyltransferase
MIKKTVKKIIPRTILQWRRRTVAAREQQKFADKTVSETFTEIYRKNVWGGKTGEFFSGEGSRGKAPVIYAETVKKFIRENNVKTVVDLGCGDFQVASMFVSKDFHYTGCDVVPDLIEHLNENYRNESVEFICLNVVEDELPAGDLCLIRQVLQHLSNREIERILDNCKKYKYLIITEHYPDPKIKLIPNLDIPHGPDVRLHFDSAVVLDAPPFNLPHLELLAEAESDEGARIKTFVSFQQ